MNKVSVIVPIYKVEEYLDRCIESIVQQSYSNIEIILVDDGSPDNCPQMCDEWALKDNRISVIHKTNGGLSSARNAGIKKACGDYILFVDSDDYIELDACERLMNYCGDVDLVVGEALIHEPDRNWHRIHTNLKENYVYSGPECAVEEIKKGEWFAAACYNCYKRTFLLDNDLFFLDGVYHEDIDFLPRLFLAAKTVKYIKYEFYNYMIRETSICGTPSPKHLNDLLLIYAKWKKLDDDIKEPRVKKKYDGALTKYFMATCREYKVSEKIFPEGMNESFLIKNALNFKEFIKIIAFVLMRKLYVRL